MELGRVERIPTCSPLPSAPAQCVKPLIPEGPGKTKGAALQRSWQGLSKWWQGGVKLCPPVFSKQALNLSHQNLGVGMGTEVSLGLVL